MKKIISLGIASAVLAMTALSASAAVTVTGPDAIKPGDTITVEFRADADLPANSATGFTVVATGVDFVADSAKAVNGGIAMYNNETGKFGFVKTDAVKAGDVLGTISYTVSAKDGENVTINVTNVEGFADTNVTPLQVTVSTGTTSEPTSEPTSDPTSTSDSTPESKPNDSSDTTSKPGDDTPPNTGVALAVFPAIIAGAAVVVAKKRK